jgi:UDP-N-acetylmuramoyl-L-alanyl-D-glutamate--2,6-diaminopimelate ligase
MTGVDSQLSVPGPARPLADLTAGFASVPDDIVVSDVTLDSRAAVPGGLFLACKGRTAHGLKFAEQAVARGARAVLYEASPDANAPKFSPDVFVAAVPLLSQRASLIADRFFGAPSQTLTMAGITGTNGKTTCAWLLAQALQFCGRPAAYMGTLGFGRPPTVTPTEHTTSDAVSVQRHLAVLRSLGAECVSMEVSSHALDQDRVTGVRFNTAAFTNLTRDHLDYHGTMEAYGAAKARLFAWPSLTNRVINVDDAFGQQLASQLSPARLVITTQKGVAADSALRKAEYVRASRVTPDPAGLVIGVDSSWGTGELTVRLIGEFNVDNVLTVLAVLLAWNIPLAQAMRSLEQCRAASGRMEMFGGRGLTPLAIVDYAHTPDALAKALGAARLHCRGQLRVVFGCGGDRDAGKRPLMGRIAAELADDIVVTDDNPRTEDPARIVADIIAGISGDVGSAGGGHGAARADVTDGARSAGRAVGVRAAPVVVEHDRALAIRLALRLSGPDDVVLVAGKGHEDYQIYGKERRPFVDQAIVTAALEGRRV